MFAFEIICQDKRARVGRLTTPHGVVETPAFLPVGTQASVKSLDARDIQEVGAQMILANTYHLYLRPGAELIEKFGGLHQFMNWHGPILTDSGGFQVFSLGFGIEHEVGKMTKLFAGQSLKVSPENSPRGLIPRTKLCKVEEEGATFQSHIDGSIHFFSPEVSVITQVKLGADFVVAMDECTSPLHDYDYTKVSMERSHRWELRSLEKLREELRAGGGEETQKMFGVVQGGAFSDLRIKSAKFVSENDFFGVGIGGALVDKLTMKAILDWIYPYLDPLKPRHLLGIGAIEDILEAVERGIDLFDCVLPTRLARNGFLLPDIDIRKAVYREDKREILPGYTYGYLHHLFRARELLAYRLATVYNLTFMANFMREVREAISSKRFAKMKEKWLPRITAVAPDFSLLSE